jgi:hypothetical protein
MEEGDGSDDDDETDKGVLPAFVVGIVMAASAPEAGDDPKENHDAITDFWVICFCLINTLDSILAASSRSGGRKL